jgi:hypothetical protein
MTGAYVLTLRVYFIPQSVFICVHLWFYQSIKMSKYAR